MVRRMLAPLAAAGLAAAPALAQEEENLNMQDVPPAARAAAQYATGVGDFNSVALDLDGGQATYEFAATGPNGTGVEVDVLPDGTVLELEHEVQMGEVPDQVTNLLRKYLPDMQPTKIERSMRTDPVTTFYEFEGTANGNEVDVEVREDGAQIVIQDDTAA